MDSFNIFFILAGTPALIIFSLFFNVPVFPATLFCVPGMELARYSDEAEFQVLYCR